MFGVDQKPSAFFQGVLQSVVFIAVQSLDELLSHVLWHLDDAKVPLISPFSRMHMDVMLQTEMFSK